MSQVGSAVLETIRSVLADKNPALREVRAADTLTGALGLDSLDLAVVVVRLEQRLGVDPFRTGRPPVATFGELVAVYEAAVAQIPGGVPA